MGVWMINRISWNSMAFHCSKWRLYYQWAPKVIIGNAIHICCTCGLKFHRLTQVNKVDTYATMHSTWWAISNHSNVWSVTRGSSVNLTSMEYNSAYNTKEYQRAKVIRNTNSNIGRYRCEKTYLLVTKRPSGCRPPHHFKAGLMAMMEYAYCVIWFIMWCDNHSQISMAFTPKFTFTV